MLLYKDSLVEIEYASAQEVLVVQLIGQKQYDASELKKVFSSTIVSSREPDIKKVLIDFGKNTVSISDINYKFIMSQLAVGLKASKVKKIARVALKDHEGEQKVASVYNEIQKAITLHLDFKNFNSKAEALEWLMK